MSGTDARQRILVVEDDYLIAMEIARGLEGRGADVIGPVGKLDEALALAGGASALDAAVLDVDLGGQKVYPLADLLQQRDIPFVFVTGYDASAIPPRFSSVSRCEKPVGINQLIEALARKRLGCAPR